LPAKTVTCTNHCSACGRHFHSVEAFDIHRTGDYRSSDPETRRRCLDPMDLEDRDGRPRLEWLTLEGECRIGSPPSFGVTIWTTAGARERMAGLWPQKAPQSAA